MVRKGGVRALWRGNGVNCLQVGPENALTFFFYESLKRYGLRDPEHPTAEQKFIFGALAGAASMSTWKGEQDQIEVLIFFSSLSALVYPMYVLQARMAIAEPGVYKGIWDCARQTVAMEGRSALLKGYLPSLLRIGPYKVWSIR
jgi:solute carrier family 25 phosphate transporter 23/24/25/41